MTMPDFDKWGALLAEDIESAVLNGEYGLYQSISEALKLAFEQGKYLGKREAFLEHN